MLQPLRLTASHNPSPQRPSQFENGQHSTLNTEGQLSARPSAEVSLEERRYENGRDPQILDVIDIPMIAPVPRVHQTENHMIDAEGYWTKDAALTWADLPSLVERPASLWLNGLSTYHGTNDCVAQIDAARLTSSLYLIKPETLNVRAQTEGGMFGPQRNGSGPTSGTTEWGTVSSSRTPSPNKRFCRAAKVHFR